MVLLGPTAAGKTDVSLQIAGDRCEIISADSVQVYKYLDIGSGKPDISKRGRIRHYLIDWIDPDVPFTAGDFCREARLSSAEIVSRGKVPLIVGGTGLYIDSFFQGLSEIPDISPEVRREIREELMNRGLSSLYEELANVDPVFGNRLHPHDTQRITRGLEVYRGTGRPLSSFYSGKLRYGTEDVLYIGLDDDREILKKRIDARVDRMIELGLIDEVKDLRRRGYGSELKSMKSIGYFEINQYLDGSINRNEAIDTIKTATKHYAKRQLTWFKKNKLVHWFTSSEQERIHDLLRRWLDADRF